MGVCLSLNSTTEKVNTYKVNDLPSIGGVIDMKVQMQICVRADTRVFQKVDRVFASENTTIKLKKVIRIEGPYHGPSIPESTSNCDGPAISSIILGPTLCEPQSRVLPAAI